MGERMEWRVTWDQFNESPARSDRFAWERVGDHYGDEGEARAAASTMRTVAVRAPDMFRAVRLEVRRVTDWAEVQA